MEFFETLVLGTELWRWLVYGAVVVTSFMLSKSVTFLFHKVMKILNKKSKLQIDDILLGAIQKPASLLLLVSGVYFGLFLIRADGGSVAELGTVSDIYSFLTTVVLTYVLARLYGELLEHYVKPIVEKTETKLDDQLLPMAVKGGRFVIWAIGLMIGFSAAGVDVTSLVAGLGIGGLALAMAAKDTIANIFGGASIFADRPFEIGDTIKVSGMTGVVEEIGVRTTRLRTYDDTVFVIPNSTVADSPLENISMRQKRRRIIEIGLTYDTTYEQLQTAKEIVAKILVDAGGIEEGPTIRLDSFGEFALILKVVYWVLVPSEYWGKIALINEEILKRFNEAKLEMAFPTQTIHVVK
jgi:MscS family membrane protein